MSRKVPEEERSEELKERLKELGYMDGGYAYEFFTIYSDLDLILDRVEDETGLRFREGDDGHASLGGNTLRITSKEGLSDSELEKVEEAVQ